MMKQDIYTEIIGKFNRQGIDYIVIGVSGINYYAEDVYNLIMTADFDVFLKPEVENVMKSVKMLKAEGFDVATKEGVIRRIGKANIEDIVKSGITLTCSNHYGNTVEFCLQVSGFTFEELNRDANIFKAGKVSIRVARLNKLLRMKEIAARDKDILFLEKYKLMFEEKKGHSKREERS
jgi:hypothetical protein